VHGISTALVIIIVQYNFKLLHYRQKQTWPKVSSWGSSKRLQLITIFAVLADHLHKRNLIYF